MQNEIVYGRNIDVLYTSQEKPKMPDLNIGSIPMGDHDRDWFTVMSRLGGRSLRANASSVLGYYVRRRKGEYQEMLEYTAKKYGLTPDECFAKLLRGDDLGKPVDGFDEAPPQVSDEG